MADSVVAQPLPPAELPDFPVGPIPLLGGNIPRPLNTVSVNPTPIRPVRFNDSSDIINDDEVDPAERRRFEGFPTSLLWEPMLANRRDPRFAMSFHNTDSFFTRRTADSEIGNTLGIIRWQSSDSAMLWEVDIFGKVMVRFSDANYHIAEDYRAGVPITYKSGNLVSKFGWEHTSTHIGDDTRELLGRRNIKWEKDEFVWAMGYLFDNQFRLYGQAGFAAFGQRVDGIEPQRWRFDIGYDWYNRASTGPKGQPFSAFHCELAGTNQYVPNFTFQIGWMWKTIDRRLSQLRVYAEFYDGRSQYGQLFRDRERYAGFAIALDY